MEWITENTYSYIYFKKIKSIRGYNQTIEPQEDTIPPIENPQKNW